MSFVKRIAKIGIFTPKSKQNLGFQPQTDTFSWSFCILWKPFVNGKQKPDGGKAWVDLCQLWVRCMKATKA